MNANEDLLVVGNLGSNSVTIFQRLPKGKLELIDTINSNGVRPVSLDILGNWLFILNQGNDDNTDVAANISILDLSLDNFGAVLYSHNLPCGEEFVADMQISPDRRFMGISSAENRDDGISIFRCYKISNDLLNEFESSPLINKMSREEVLVLAGFLIVNEWPLLILPDLRKSSIFL